MDKPNEGEIQSYGEIIGITGARSLRSVSDPTAVAIAYWNAQSTTIGKKAKGPPSKPPNGGGKEGEVKQTATQNREFSRPSLPIQQGTVRSDSSSSTDSDIRRSRNHSTNRGGHAQRGDLRRRSRSPTRPSDYHDVVARLKELEERLPKLEGELSTLKKDKERLSAENKVLKQDAEFLREKNVRFTGREFQLAFGSVEQGSTTTFMDMVQVAPMGEGEAEAYKRLGNLPHYVTIMSSSMLAALSVNCKNAERKAVASHTTVIEYNYNRGTDYNAKIHDIIAVITYPVIITATTEGVLKDYGVTNLVGVVVPDKMLADNGAGQVQFMTGNLHAALQSADHRKGGGLFTKESDYEWHVSFSDLGMDFLATELKNPTPTVPMLHKMHVAAGNKPLINYSTLQLQDEVGGKGGGVKKNEESTWGKQITTSFDRLSLQSQETDYTQIKKIPAALGTEPESGRDIRQHKNVLTIGKKSNPIELQDSDDDYPSLSRNKVSKGTTPTGTKKTFYDAHTESFDDVCASSKWSANGYLLKGTSVKFAGEVYPLDVGLSAIIAEGIPIVAPDAPFRAGQETRGDKGPRAPEKFSTKPWPNTCNFALFGDTVKGMAAEVIPGFRSNQNLNHEEGKQLFMAIMKSGFSKAPDGSESEGKQWLVDHNISPSDPLALNMALALIASRFNTEEHQADILRNFQGGEQGDERLATYFDAMLASAKGAHATMSYQQQANTIRAGMRKSRVKAQLLGKPIPKMTSYEELVTLVKHTWLPEAVNHGEDGPVVPRTPSKTAAAPIKQVEKTPKKVCSHCGKDSHKESKCWLQNPERSPSWFKSESEKAEGKSTEGTQSSTDGKAGESSKKGESSNTSSGKEGAGNGKDSGATSKPTRK